MKWTELKLSEEFNNTQYYPTTYKKTLAEVNGKHFELGYHEFADIANTPNMSWNISHNCRLQFKVNVNDNALESKLIGWGTYIISETRAKRKRFRFLCKIKNLDSELQFQVIVFYKRKLSTNAIHEYRLILQKALENEVSDKTHLEVNNLFISGFLNRTLSDCLKGVSDLIKEVEIYKCKIA